MKEKKRTLKIGFDHTLKMIEGGLLMTAGVALGASAISDYQNGDTTAAITKGVVAIGCELVGGGTIAKTSADIHAARKMGGVLEGVADCVGQLMGPASATTGEIEAPVDEAGDDEVVDLEDTTDQQ